MRELGIGLVPFCPLGRGFLAGGVKRAEDYPEGDTRHNDERYQGENYDANVRAAQAAFDTATSKDAKPAQIALAWLLHKGDFIVPIPGTKRRGFLEQNAAADAVRLAPAEMRTLDEALGAGTISGNRYPDWVMAGIDR